MFKRIPTLFLTAATLSLITLTGAVAQDDAANSIQSGYASVNGLEMYYEISGAGEPLVVIHGAYQSIESMGAIIPKLAESRQVIAVELQGHGRTGDIDRPLAFEQLADDVAALMEAIGIDRADIFGYSVGGSTALQLAIRHPEVVRKLVIVSAVYDREGWYPELLGFMETMTPEVFAGSPMEAEYTRLSPSPENFPAMVGKLTQLTLEQQGWTSESLEGIEAPALLLAGDSDQVRPEHTLALFRLLGGGVPGDLVGLPNSQLAIITAATHVSILTRVDLLNTLTVEVLDAPLPENQ
jgi:pimeloyl-ACP methyl ester carboxylesterase